MTTRQLADSDPAPDCEPRRYIQSQGYIILRWKIGPGSYVERREHRHVMIRLGHDLAGREVHHINGVRSDNRPENLDVLSPAAHGKAHRELDHALIVALYLSGHNTVTTAEQMACNPATVSRVLAEAGVEVRPRGPRVDLPLDHVRDLYLAGFSPAAIAGRLGVPGHVTAVRERVRALGLPQRPSGRYGDASREVGGCLSPQTVLNLGITEEGMPS